MDRDCLADTKLRRTGEAAKSHARKQADNKARANGCVCLSLSLSLSLSRSLALALSRSLSLSLALSRSLSLSLAFFRSLSLSPRSRSRSLLARSRSRSLVARSRSLSLALARSLSLALARLLSLSLSLSRSRSLSLSLSLSLALSRSLAPSLALSLSLFWTLRRDPRGVTSEATQHCCENNCHNIHYNDQAGQTVKERHLVAGKLSSKRHKFRQSRENGTMVNPLFSCKLFRLKASYLCACQTHYWGHRGTSTSVPSVSKTPVHHRRQPSTPSIDATHGRHHSEPLPTPTIDAIHRRHQSSATQSISDNPSALGHYHKPNQRTYQLLLHFDNAKPSRTSGSAVNPGLFRRRAQPVFHG